jgi:hypothetical protein
MNESQALTKIEPMPSVMDEPRSPQALMRRATDVAGICREIVLKTACEIQGRKFVRVEGWESIATAHGCFAGAEDAERVYDNQGNHIGYKAKGVLRNAHGEVIATGEGYVGFDEKDRKGNPTWKNRAEYAGKAMAQTRAISRTCRGVFAHVIVLIDAGLSTTPAEEVPDGGFDDNARASRAKPANVPRVEQSKPSTPANQSTAKPAGSASPSAPPAQVATEKTRAWFLAEMRKRFKDGTLLMWAMDDGPPYAVGPDQTLEEWRLGNVPTSKPALDAAIARCAEFTGVEPTAQAEVPQDAAAQARQREAEMDAIEPPGGWQGAAQGELQDEQAQDDGTETMVGLLEAVSEKSGTSKKGKWTRYGVKVSGRWFGTFNATLAKAAASDKNHSVRVYYKPGEKGDDLVGIERARQSP